MNPPSIDDFKIAYQSCRLRPIRGFFYVHDFACPILALALHRGVVDQPDPDLAKDTATVAAFEWASEQFGEDWVKGLIDGFDRQFPRADSAAYLEGYKQGELLAQEILPGERVN